MFAIDLIGYCPVTFCMICVLRFIRDVKSVGLNLREIILLGIAEAYILIYLMNIY